MELSYLIYMHSLHQYGLNPGREIGTLQYVDIVAYDETMYSILANVEVLIKNTVELFYLCIITLLFLILFYTYFHISVLLFTYFLLKIIFITFYFCNLVIFSLILFHLPSKHNQTQKDIIYPFSVCDINLNKKK